uniref:Conserved oligomeric Golgi complex subunit 3 n=1 Tax=Plectus sambesii TaxID=2011161 RepID=A0A914VI18_9BILA
MTTFEELLRETTCTLEPLAMNYLFKIRDKKFPVIEQQSMPSTSDAYAKFVASYLTKENSEDDTLERDELVELKKCGEEVKTAHTRLETCRGALETLKDRYEVVAENTSSLHDACDQLMADQTRLAAAAEDIRAKLYYFDHVQPLMQKLNSTHMAVGGQADILKFDFSTIFTSTVEYTLFQKLNSTHMAVGGQAFTHALSTIDECLAFLHKQRDYLDAQAYITKYEQCLSRALTAVKSYVQSTLAASAQAVKQKSSDDDDHFAALYGVFATHANAVRVVMETVESKFDRAQE